MLIDTHAHLYWDVFEKDLDQVIQRSIDAGVNTIINVGVDVEKSKIAARQVKEKLSKIPNFFSFSTIGIHPHEAIKYQDDVSIHEDIKKLEEIYQTQPDHIVAVGECGLDFYLDRNDIHPDITLPYGQIKNLQRQLFQVQIDLAKKLNLPLIVHCRDDRSKGSGSTGLPPQETLSPSAWDEVLNMVGNHPTILHCYSGLPKTTNLVLSSSNLFVSFAATITYPKNEYLRDAARILPLEKILLETDCPFLPPQSRRGQRNEPANVLETAQLIADLKNISLEQLNNQTSNNVKRILKLN
ncbi:MAG: TatD family hydrolase [Candidatus Daviesbacteria bacterium]|nr:TatD family hydrolase [Candidatus Daviesbacteria bacterium]